MCAAIQTHCSQTLQPVPQSPGEFARCVFESLSFAYRAVLEDLERITGRHLRVIRVVGGGCLNPVLCQMTADACGREVVAGPVEAAALGNAMVQAVATGHMKDLSEGQAALSQSVELRRYQPTQSAEWLEAFERYNSVLARSLDLAPALKP
jgi:rhamnulokinase